MSPMVISGKSIPPAGIVVFIVSGNVGVAGESVTDQHGIIFSDIEFAVCFVSDSHFGQCTAEFEGKRRVEGRFLQIFKWIRIANRVRTGKVH